MAGRTGIVKKGKLYGDWGLSEMEQGVDEAQAAGAAALTEKPKYKGWKSDLAFIAAQKKKKLAAEEKRKSERKIKKATDTTGYKVVKGDSPEMESYAPPKKKKVKKKRVGRTLY